MAEASVTMPESEWRTLTAAAKGAVVAAKESVVSFGREGPTSNKALLMTILATAGGFWALQTDAVKKIQVFVENWWLKGVLLVAAGWWLWKKRNPWWGVVAGLGATTLAADYQTYQAAQEKKPAAGVDEAGAPLYDWQIGPD